MSDELLPCPFCGFSARLTENGDNSPNWIAHCTNWNCCAEQGHTRTETEAVAAWNRRAAQAVHRELLAAAKAYLVWVDGGSDGTHDQRGKIRDRLRAAVERAKEAHHA